MKEQSVEAKLLWFKKKKEDHQSSAISLVNFFLHFFLSFSFFFSPAVSEIYSIKNFPTARDFVSRTRIHLVLPGRVFTLGSLHRHLKAKRKKLQRKVLKGLFSADVRKRAGSVFFRFTTDTLRNSSSLGGQRAGHSANIRLDAGST